MVHLWHCHHKVASGLGPFGCAGVRRDLLRQGQLKVLQSKAKGEHVMSKTTHSHCTQRG